MTTFQVIRLPPLEKFDISHFRKVVNNNSIYNDTKRLKEGFFPDSFEKYGNIFHFEYGFEFDFQIPTLDGSNLIPALQRVMVIFFGEKFGAIGFTTKYSNETEPKTKSFIEKKIIKGFILKPIIIDEKDLRKIIQEYPEIAAAKFNPSKEDQPEVILAQDPNLLQTEFWDDYGDFPIEKLKIKISDLEDQALVGLSKGGQIVIYNKSYRMKEQILVLSYLIDKIIKPYVRKKSRGFQKTLI